MFDQEQWEQLLVSFLEEAKELIQSAETALLTLDEQSSDADTINGLFRAMHTLKGSAGLFSLDGFVRFSHQMENLIMRVRDGELVLNGEMITALLSALDILRGEITQLEQTGTPSALDEANPELLSLLQTLGNSGLSAPPATTTSSESVERQPVAAANLLASWHISLRFDRQILQYGFDPASFVRYLRKLGTLQHIYLIQSELPDWPDFQAENCYLGLELDLQTEASKAEIESVFEFIQELAQIRILPPDSQVEDYLSLIAALPQDEDRLGEILVASGLLTANELARSLQKQTEQTPTAKIGDMLVQDGAVPAIAVDAALQKQQQIRDTSKDLGKEIQLQINGAETELDKTVIDKIADPLTHLVRNALDHGIETAEERLAAGKPAKGVLCLNAYHESGNVVIEVQDDGRGLNPERIRQKALEKGLLNANEQLDDQALYQLIFAPGFSTADSISNLSGRGVGMDVVKRSIDALRGSIELDSVPGKGCGVRIRLPLTLAIIDGFLVSVGDTPLVIPLDMVTECLEAEHEPITSTYDYRELRGKPLPLIHLRQHFSIHSSKAKRQNIVVVSHGKQQLGLVVDHLLGEQQIVIKPLGSLFMQLKDISGSSILGSGQVALILDIPGMLQRMRESVRTPVYAHLS